MEAIQAVFVQARFMASMGDIQQKTLVALLDAAEVLPKLVVDSTDRTTEFSACLEEIGEIVPRCRVIHRNFVSESSVGEQTAA